MVLSPDETLHPRRPLLELFVDLVLGHEGECDERLRPCGVETIEAIGWRKSSEKLVVLDRIEHEFRAVGELLDHIHGSFVDDKAIAAALTFAKKESARLEAKLVGLRLEHRRSGSGEAAHALQ